MKKEVNKGITLITLVITIILLIILAGVVINLALGENGLLNRAKYAKDKYLNAQETEKQDINDLYSQMLIATNDSSQITINVKQLIDIIYPVGSIYISTSETNPSEIMGGEWESYGEGKTLIGAGTGTDENNTTRTFTANSTGGEYNHSLTTGELPNLSGSFGCHVPGDHSKYRKGIFEATILGTSDVHAPDRRKWKWYYMGIFCKHWK